MREKGQTEVTKTLETPVFSRGIEILTEKLILFSNPLPFRSCKLPRVDKCPIPLNDFTLKSINLSGYVSFTFSII